MKWSNTQLDKTPAHGEVVLIAVDGVYYIASYSKKELLFRLKDDPDVYFDPLLKTIYWTAFTNPD